MEITLAMVCSADGLITKAEEPTIYTWTSPEDQQHFFSLIEEYPVIVMGRATYEAAAPVMKLKPGKLRLVLTRQPHQFEQMVVPGQLEFTNQTVDELIQNLKKAGTPKVLLVGGGEVNAAFLQARKVDRVLLTREPRMFGVGKRLVAQELKPEVQLRLIALRQLNQQGTCLFEYQVI